VTDTITTAEVTGCADCPFLENTTWSPDNCACMHPEAVETKSRAQRWVRLGKPEPPDWCPLRKSPLLVTLVTLVTLRTT
jgi:hypothetical protein